MTALRIAKPCLIAALLLATSSAAASAPAIDPRSVHKQFESELSAARNARESMAIFLSRWIAQASDAEIALLGTSQQDWTRYGSEPRLYILFLSDYSFRKQLAEYLAPLQSALQRVPEMRAQAPWQALLARAQLDAGELDAGWESAQRAWKLDPRLCAEDCPALVLAWLQTGRAPGPETWPALVAPAVYNPARVDCESAPDSLQPEPLAWAVPPDDLIEAVLGGHAQVAWLVREEWAMNLRGCNRGAQWRLRQALEEHFPGPELEQAWWELEASMQARRTSARSGPLELFGQSLPLPAQECDFAVDAKCESRFRPLSDEAVRTLLGSLRSASRLFSGPASCPAPGAGTSEPFSLEKQRAMRETVAKISKLPIKDAVAPLRMLLEDQAFARMWATDVPNEIAELMTDLARIDRHLAADLLLLAQAWIGSAPIRMQQSPSAGDLLAVLMLRNRRPDEGLIHLQQAQESLAEMDRALRISQLLAGLQGAELDASLPQADIPRPWVYGQSSSDKAVSASLPFERSTRLDGVRVDDVIFGLGDAKAVAERRLRTHWLPWLLGHGDVEEALFASLREAYGEVSLRERMLKAIAHLQLSPAPHLLFEQVPLPLPDRICTADPCTTSPAVNQRWVLQRLEGLLGELSEAEEMKFRGDGETLSPDAVR